jgi:type IV pilus assembly protein PilM
MFTIGLTLEKEAFKIAVLKKEKKTIAIESLKTFPYGPDNVKLFYNLPPFHTGKEVEIVSGLAGEEVFIRKLHLPLREKRKILATLPFQIESLIPFPNESPIICPLLKPLSKQMTIVTVIATVQTHIASLIASLKGIDRYRAQEGFVNFGLCETKSNRSEAFRMRSPSLNGKGDEENRFGEVAASPNSQNLTERGIEPDTISCHPVALVRFARWQFPEEYRILCFDVRDQKISCALLEGSELILSQTISLSQIEQVPFELEKLSVFLGQKGAIDEQTPWLLTGDSNHLAEILSQFFPGQRLNLTECGIAEYAIPLGLALDAIAADDSSVQFCQKEFTPKHTFQKRRKKMLQYLTICLSATLLMSIGGSFALNKKEHLLANQLQSYFSSSKELISSSDQIEEKLHAWESSLRGQKSSFAFLPTVPKVSDVLAWLSTHPVFATEEGGQKEGIEIKSLHYNLVKYPKINEVSSPYSAQMELEFTSLTPRHARDFHEALLKGDQIVNAKKEVKWQTQNQTYYTSFELNKGTGS